MAMRYDVIVVGAGPSGSTTARECATRGLSVLLLDRSEFPRDKPCGGGVTVRAAALLPFSIDPVVERVIYRVWITERRSRGFERSSPNEVAYLTQRSRLDAFLVERAISEGAVFRQREAIREVERHPTHVVVRTSNDSFEGRTLVAADGANGSTTKLAGLKVRHLQGIAVEGNISPDGGIPEKWKDRLGFNFGDISGGYGWIFPKGDHLNIGIGGWRHNGPNLREKLTHLVRSYGFDPAKLWGMRGHPLPLRRRGSPLVDGNVLLVGDAAGLVDPFTGEGIYTAWWSGSKAAEQLSAYLGGLVPDLDGYRRDVERVLLPELRVSRQFHDIFHLWPGLFVGIERRTAIPWEAIVRVIRGDKTYLTVVRKLGPLWTVLEFVSDLVRVSPPLRHLSGLRDPAPPERFFRWGAHHPTPHL
jgi:geranylgeranyl reductase family protein